MKKIFLFLVIFLFTQNVQAEVLKAGVSLDDIPNALYGSWRVSAKLDKTNAPRLYKAQSIDFWNLSRVNDTIKLDNPFSGASAEISVQTVEDEIVVFSKKLPYPF